MPDEMSAEQYREMTTRAGRGNKYGAKRIEVDGYTFASLAEAKRYGELKLMQQAGAITALEPHPPFDLTVNGIVVGRYTADFRYVEVATGETVVEDVKGGRATGTEAYGLRKRLMKAIHGIEIVEVTE